MQHSLSLSYPSILSVIFSSSVEPVHGWWKKGAGTQHGIRTKTVTLCVWHELLFRLHRVYTVTYVVYLGSAIQHVPIYILLYSQIADTSNLCNSFQLSVTKKFIRTFFVGNLMQNILCLIIFSEITCFSRGKPKKQHFQTFSYLKKRVGGLAAVGFPQHKKGLNGNFQRLNLRQQFFYFQHHYQTYNSRTSNTSLLVTTISVWKSFSMYIQGGLFKTQLKTYIYNKC